jgi:hypothetical protein
MRPLHESPGQLGRPDLVDGVKWPDHEARLIEGEASPSARGVVVA